MKGLTISLPFLLVIILCVTVEVIVLIKLNYYLKKRGEIK